MSARTTRTGLTTAGIAAALLLASCGGSSGPPGGSGAATGSFRVTVTRASFPTAQRLAQPVHMLLAIRNSGDRPLPDVAVTICNITCAHPPPAGGGTQAAAFSTVIGQLPSLADPSRPVWIVTTPPGPCGYGCAGGAQGGAVTAYSNTWALGRLEPGQTATFDWALTAVRAGHHTVAWKVSPALRGDGRALLAGGGPAQGTISVDVTRSPERYRVNGRGQVVSDG